MKEIEVEQGTFDDFSTQEEEVIEPNTRYGKLYIKENWYTQDNMRDEISALFKVFLPTRIEFLYHSHIFEMFGYSELFGEMGIGDTTFPVYDIFMQDGAVRFECRGNE